MKKTRLKLLSIRGRIISVFLGIMLLAIVVFGTYATQHVYNKIMENTYKNMNLMIDATSENINSSFILIENTTIALSTSTAVNEWINNQQYFEKTNPDYYLNTQNLNNEFQNILTRNNVWKLDFLTYVTIYQNEHIIGYTYTVPVSVQTILEDSKKTYNKLIKNRDKYVQKIAPTEENQIFFYTRKLKSDFESDNNLLIIAGTSESYIEKRYESLLSDKGAIVYLVDENETIYSSNEKNLLGSKLPKELTTRDGLIKDKNIMYRNQEYSIVSRKIDTNGFRLIYMLPKANLVKETISGMSGFLLVSILLGLLFIVLAILGSMRTTNFIKDITDAMNKVKEKDYDVRMPEYKDDTLNGLSSTFNSMTTEIQNLIQSTYESKILLNEMEIKFLQYQMNPHFLFNILLTIQIKAKMSGNDTIYDMIAALSALLRAGIYGDKRAIITIEEELKYVEFYLSLQQMRYEDRLTYEINVSDEILKTYEIPRLIIEPIVENAIIHGVEKIVEKAVVTVNIEEVDEDIHIIVKDNGRGFNVQEIMKNQKIKVDQTQSPRENIGLKNTDYRLKLIYGQQYGLKIQSEENIGTTIDIIIPKRGRSTENV